MCTITYSSTYSTIHYTSFTITICIYTLALCHTSYNIIPHTPHIHYTPYTPCTLELGYPVKVCSTAEEAVRASDVVFTQTPANKVVLEESWLKSHATIIGMYGYTLAYECLCMLCVYVCIHMCVHYRTDMYTCLSMFVWLYIWTYGFYEYKRST